MEGAQKLGESLRKFFRCGAIIVMVLTSSGQALAAVNALGCTREEDVYALRAAAVQQRLMVAALSCQAVDRYNKFVTAFRNDLQVSDVALQRFFQRLNGRTGGADYHTFKTRLANTSANQSVDDRQGYCASAEATFADALSGRSKSLRNFVSDKPAEAERDYAPCSAVRASAAKRASGK
jgi:hypothetical protein